MYRPAVKPYSITTPLQRQARHLSKTSCRCPKDVLNANLIVIFVIHLEDTLIYYKIYCRCFTEDVLKMSY